MIPSVQVGNVSQAGKLGVRQGWEVVGVDLLQYHRNKNTRGEIHLDP